MRVWGEHEGTDGCATAGATNPGDLDDATRIGGGCFSSQGSTLATVEIGIGGTLDRVVCVDLTDDRLYRCGCADRVALVNGAIDGDLGNIAVG